MAIALPLLVLFLAVCQCQSYYVPAPFYIPVNPHQIGWNSSYYGLKNASWTGPGHLFWGRIGPLDRLLFDKNYFNDSRWWSSREKIIEYPKDVMNGYVRHETISAIHIINKFYQGHHSNATILSGGVGRQYARIKLSSKRGYGFSFLVQIFGH